MDSIGDEAEEKKFQQSKNAHFRNRGRLEGDEEKIKGSYGTGKAKKNSQNMHRIVSDLQRTGSILIVIGQSRDNIAMFAPEKKTRAGGHALSFYAAIELWSSIKERLHKKWKGHR